MSYQHISAKKVSEWLSGGEPLQLVDVRSPQDRQLLLPGAIGGDDTAGLAGLDPDVATVVYCYQGISSQSAAASLAEAGFAEVYSMDGGFDAWKEIFGDTVEAAASPDQ